MKQQIIIAETVAHDPKFCPHENYGPDFQGIISQKSARGLCGMYPLPRPSYETCVAVNRLYGNLYVANIAGYYVLRSASVRVADWPEHYGVTLTRKTV